MGKKGEAQNNINWVTVRNEYVTTAQSLDKLAAKYGIARANIGRMSTQENWKQQRKEYREKVGWKTQQLLARKESRHLAKLIGATTRAVDVACEALNDKQQFNRYLVQHKEKYIVPIKTDDGKCISEREVCEERQFEKVDTKALKELTGTLKDLTSLMREFYDLPTAAQAEQRKINLEKHNADMAEALAHQKDDQPKQIAVEMKPFEGMDE